MLTTQKKFDIHREINYAKQIYSVTKHLIANFLIHDTLKEVTSVSCNLDKIYQK